MKSAKDKRREKTYKVLVDELSKNLKLQQDNPGKIVATMFYFYDIWGEYPGHAEAADIFIGNIQKSRCEETDALLSHVDFSSPFLKFNVIIHTDEEFDEFKQYFHPDDYMAVKQKYEYGDGEKGTLYDCTFSCGQDVHQAAEYLTKLYLDIFEINPFFFSGYGTSIPSFITVVAEVNSKNSSWKDAIQAIMKKIDYRPLFKSCL